VYFYRPSEGHGLPHDPFNALVAPRPIGWISSRSAAGVLNVAPYSFFNAFNYKPPIIGFASIGYKDSVRNIEETREFVWNLATRPVAESMNATSATVARDVDEFELSGLSTAPSRVVDVPRVAEAPVSMECRLSQLVQLTSDEGVKVTTCDGSAVRPLSSNSSTSRATVAEVAFIASAMGRVARFQTNSLVAETLRTLSL